jgi:prepilin-type N-terminal cleavage/methylation domain-containing protein
MTLGEPHRARALLGRAAASPWRGFTLIELVIVLTLLGILFSFAAPRLGGLTPKYRLRTYARKLAGTLEKMRVAAIVQGKTTGIRYLLDESDGEPQRFEVLMPAPSDYPDQPLEERRGAIVEAAPEGVRFRGVIVPGARGGMISRGLVHIAFTPSGTTGSHIVILEVPGVDGQPEILSVKYNTISGIIDYYNQEVDFLHFQS